MQGWEPFVSVGSTSLPLLVLWMIVQAGSLRTKFEARAWEDRAVRAEKQVDKLVPAVESLTVQVSSLVSVVERMLDRLEDEIGRSQSPQARR